MGDKRTGLAWLWAIAAFGYSISLVHWHWQTSLLVALSGAVVFPPLSRLIDEEKFYFWRDLQPFLAAALVIAAVVTDHVITTPQERAAEVAQAKRDAAETAQERAKQEAETKRAEETAAREQARKDADDQRARDKEELENGKTEAFSVCEVKIKERLRDPDSAEFPSDYEGWNTSQPTPSAAGNIYTALVKVRGSNGFGGKTLSFFTCSVIRQTDGWLVLSLKENNADN